MLESRPRDVSAEAYGHDGGSGDDRKGGVQVKTSILVFFVVVGIGATTGFIVYESLMRMFSPAARKGRTTADLERGEVGKRLDRISHVGIRGLSRARLQPGIVSIARWIDHFLPMARADSVACREMLARAGWTIEPETWRGLRVIMAFGCGVFGLGVLVRFGVFTPESVGGVVGAVVAGWFVPRFLLVRRTTKRRRVMEAQLPDAMELLGIAVAAGSPIEQCFRDVAENLEGPLSEEFTAVDREVNLLGHSREEALDKLAYRCGSQEITAFASQLTQAISQGASIAEGLSAQADLARETAQAQTLERIRTMSTKLDIVLSFCFLPPTIALVVVPTVVKLLTFLNDTLQ